MKICLAIKGDIQNKKLWSGTPSFIYDYMSKKMDVDILNWESNRLLSRFIEKIVSKVMFVWAGAAAPIFHQYEECLISKKIKALKKHYDYILFVPDICVPKGHSEKFALYTDAILADLAPYFHQKNGQKWFMKHYERNVCYDYNQASIIFTQNEWTKQSMISRYNVASKKIHNIGFGVALQPYLEEKDYSKELLLIVLRKGTEHYKGLYLLLDAFKILNKKRPQVKLAIIGTEAKENIEGVTYYYNTPREVTLELFKQCTLYTMPAIREPNGITYLEALANRAPIFGLNRFALPEFSGYGEWGFLAQNEDPQEIAEIIDKALSDPARLREMGVKGQKFVMERYRWEIVIDKMIAEMEKALIT